MLDRNLFALPGASCMLAALCVLTLLKAAAVVGQAWTLATAVDLLRAGSPLTDAALALAGFLVCFMARQAVVFFQDGMLERYAGERVAQLRSGLLQRVFAEGPLFVGAMGTGNVVMLALEGAEQVENYLRLVLPKIAGVVIIPLVLLAFAFPFDWVSGLIMLIVFPFIIFYMVLLGKTAKAEADKQLKKGPVTHSRGISQNAFLVLWKTTMPAVLVETGFMSNAADIKILNSSEGRSEIARRLCDAFKAFKVKYDASLDYAAEPSAAESSSVRKPDDSPAETPAAVRDGYGVQIFALSKKLPAGDASLKGYEADAVKAGSMYKYIIRCNTADEARKLFRKTRKEFPGSFPVQIRSGEVSALK